MGGEKAKGKPKSQGHLGSPPRGRGKVETISSNSRAEGITPAWAGKSRAAVPAEQLIRDHPRVGGEKYAGRRHRGDLKGSPPRGRGKGQLHPWAAFHAGITPAWAGKRHTLKTSSRDDWDHPRVGGEKSYFKCMIDTPIGSPPRGRGKVIKHLVQQLHGGITPAWAGKSSSIRNRRGHQEDHPRVGGEKAVTSAVPSMVLGSPPRGRGKVRKNGAPIRTGRITPAGAGKSKKSSSSKKSSRDHPRVGGEKFTPHLLAVLVLGSPPRGRGKAHRPRCQFEG